MRVTCKRAVCAVGLLAIFSYIAFFYKLGDLAFIGADEARYAEVAREMVEHHDYVTPRLDYRPWFEKPPLYYWTTALFFHWLGVSEFSARLGSALLALSGVLFVFFFGGKVFSYRVGFLSALILLTSSEYFVLGRAATTDIGLAVTLTIGLGCFYMGLITPTPSRIFFSLAAYLFFGLAVLAKGPAGILLPLLIILGYFISTRQYHKVYEIQLLPGLLLFLVVVLPWHILMIERHRFAFIASFFLNHNLARFFTR
ncbi:MAG: glycosyltransferase family 39 protein, partial [Acidobacteria bacterium]|nr:glycosyltransferase family 39 protein [Acidobacteriota bacterium]